VKYTFIEEEECATSKAEEKCTVNVDGSRGLWERLRLSKAERTIVEEDEESVTTKSER
jgi:hypothetical protein